MNGSDQKTERLEMRKRAERNQRAITTALLTFLAIASLIIYFDIGKTELAKFFSNAVGSIVPSIAKTALITKAPESSAFVLSIAWALVPVSVFWMFQVSNWRKVTVQDIERNQPAWGRGMSSITKLFLFAFGIVFFIWMLFASPNPDGSFKYIRMVYENLEAHRYFITFYSMVIWLLASVLIWGLTIFFRLTQRHLKGEQK